MLLGVLELKRLQIAHNMSIYDKSGKQMILPKKQIGFTLIEVLVALIVVAIGLLGLAALQTVGLRNNHSTNLTSQAIWLANDITDRIRSNPSGDYNNISPQQPPNCSPCTPQQMAEIDILEWNQTVNQTLPNANTVVCIDSDPLDNQNCVNANAANIPGTPFMVRITWDDPAQANGSQQLVTFFLR